MRFGKQRERKRERTFYDFFLSFFRFQRGRRRRWLLTIEDSHWLSSTVLCVFDCVWVWGQVHGSEMKAWPWKKISKMKRRRVISIIQDSRPILSFFTRKRKKFFFFHSFWDIFFSCDLKTMIFFLSFYCGIEKSSSSMIVILSLRGATRSKRTHHTHVLWTPCIWYIVCDVISGEEDLPWKREGSDEMGRNQSWSSLTIVCLIKKSIKPFNLVVTCRSCWCYFFLAGRQVNFSKLRVPSPFSIMIFHDDFYEDWVITQAQSSVKIQLVSL